jgi:hypothetical protein
MWPTNYDFFQPVESLSKVKCDKIECLLGLCNFRKRTFSPVTIYGLHLQSFVFVCLSISVHYQFT